MGHLWRKAGAVSGMGLLGLITACSQSAASYSSPEKAVAAACHPEKIRGVYTYRQDSPAAQRINIVPGRTQVGWQAPGQAVDAGWVALVEKHGGGYRVTNCKWKVNVHG